MFSYMLAIFFLFLGPQEAKKYASAAEVATIDAEEGAALEANRKEWIAYYTEGSDYDAACKLCVSPEEETELEKAFDAKRVEYMTQQVYIYYMYIDK